MAITTAQIHAAADQIDRSGNRPTLAAIRTILKGGSFTTIQQAMLSWKKLDDEVAIEVDDVPEEVAEEGEKMTAAIWQLCTKLAGSKFDDERNVITEKLKTETSLRETLMSTLDDMAAENDAYRETVKGQTEALAAAHDQETKLRNTIAVYEAQVKALQELAAERLKTIEAMTKGDRKAPAKPTEAKPTTTKQGTKPKKAKQMDIESIPEAREDESHSEASM